MRLLGLLALILLTLPLLMMAYADEGIEEQGAAPVQVKPTLLSYQFSMSGPLYDKLAPAIMDKWREIDPLSLPTLGIHEVDLNGDSFPEYIVRLEEEYFSCNKNGCHHAIIAISGEETKLLGYFEYCEIEVSTNATEGVLDLIVHNNDLNDYSGVVHKWNPVTQIYEKNRQ